MAFPCKARHLKPGDRINLGKYPSARKLSPENPWGVMAGMRREDDGRLLLFFFLGEQGIKVPVEYDKYFQTERSE